MYQWTCKQYSIYIWSLLQNYLPIVGCGDKNKKSYCWFSIIWLFVTDNKVMANNLDQEALQQELKKRKICRFCLSQSISKLTNIYMRDTRIKSSAPLPIQVMAIASIEVIKHYYPHRMQNVNCYLRGVVFPPFPSSQKIGRTTDDRLSVSAIFSDAK